MSDRSGPAPEQPAESRSLARVRAWVLAAAAAGFVAGVSIGFAVPVAANALGLYRTRGSNFELAEKFARKYDLSKEQEREIRKVLTNRDRDLLGAVREYKESLPQQLRFRLEQLRREADELIEWAVLTEAQRTQYQRDSRFEDGK